MTLVQIALKIKVISASTEKLYCYVICISTTSKVGNYPAFKRLRMVNFLVEMQ